VGIETWKSIAGKAKETVVEDDGIPENVDGDNRELAEKDLGTDYSEEDFQLWLENKNTFDRENNAEFEERDIMPDDDGDGDDSYFNDY
jgi:hypothetical protein